MSVSADKADPAYGDGFWAFMHATGFDADRSHDKQYVHGWDAAKRVAVLMAENGFKRTGDGFSKTVSIHQDEDTQP